MYGFSDDDMGTQWRGNSSDENEVQTHEDEDGCVVGGIKQQLATSISGRAIELSRPAKHSATKPYWHAKAVYLGQV